LTIPVPKTHRFVLADEFSSRRRSQLALTPEMEPMTHNVAAGAGATQKASRREWIGLGAPAWPS